MENRRMSRNVFPLSIIKDDIVISGIGGRYPESDSLDEFRDNLFNNVDMITGDDRRWPTPVYGISPRMGMLKEVDKFDASFFGVVPKVADEVDPHGRILLETTWEAIVDAGINPQSLRGSNTGVYVGYTSVAMPDGVPHEVQRDVQASKVESLLWFQGASKAFYSNRVSFVFDFHGPSMSIDVACASSMVCLDIAVTDMRLGKCDQAIVAGVSINLNPFTNHIYQANSIGAPDGRSKVWDQSANGYVRGETVASIFLQKKPDSKRIYATVLHAKTNIDGYKISGMFFPSTDSQYDLMVKTYTEAGVDPLDVNYFEGHGTGTKAGDPQEARAIMEAYCKGRKGVLPVGLLKSNIGHGEGASGVASLSKLCIVYENKKIPANLNMTVLKEDIAVMSPPLVPVTANRSYEPGIVGVNSFGIGGVNAHALLKPNKKEITAESLQIADQIPRLVNMNGRTEEAVNHIFEFMEKNPDRVTREFLALIGETVNYEPSIYSSGFPYRGSMLIKKDADSGKLTYSKKVSKVDNNKRPICYFFSGMGSQWSAMAKSLMGIDLFANAIQRCAEHLKKVNIDLKYILLSEDPKALEEKIHHFVAITSMQIALADVFKALGIEPDYIIGHSFGEIACAYADGCLTLEQAIITSYWRGKAIKDANVEHGMMAAVGLSWEDTVKRCPEGVYAACHNSIDSVTISGAYDKVNGCVQQLTAEKIFAREVQCANIPFHSPLLQPAARRMTEALQEVIPQPKTRSSKWISTSVAQSEVSKATAASPQYFVNNLINPVLFHDASKLIPKEAIIIELAPHALFSAIFKRSMPAASYVGLMKRNGNATNLDMYLNALGQLYQLGVSLSLAPLYPSVQWPVPRNTQSIGSLVRWDHNKSYLVKKYPEYHCRATASDYVQKFSLANPDDQFLKDHAFDGKCVLPASAYLLMVWRRLASSRGLLWYHFPVVFENVEFKRLTPMSENEVKLSVRLLDPTGEFVVLDGGNVAASGRVYCPEEDKLPLNYQNLIDNFSIESDEWKGHKLNMNEFYTETNVRGFDYGPSFKQIQEVEFDGFDRSRAQVKWENNWVTFVESMIQLYATHTTARSIHVAQSLPSLKCDPRVLWGTTPANIPVITDAGLKCVVSRGIEMKGLKFANIPLKNVMRDVKLEKYEFVPFTEAGAIEDVDARELQTYINSCNLVADRLSALLQKGDSAKGASISAILHRPHADNEVLLKLLAEMYKSVVDENGNPTGQNISGDLVRKIIAANSLDFSKDLLNSVTKNGRMMRSSLDVVNENCLRNMNVIEANYSNGSIVKDLLQHMGYFFHYPLVVDCVLATKDTKALPKEVQNAGYQLLDWNTVSSSALPAIEAPADLLIYKDSPELTKMNLKTFAKDLANNVKEGGFLFAVFRSKLCKAESLLNHITGSSQSTPSLVQRIADFESSAVNAGFNLISKKTDSITSTCLLLRKAFAEVEPTKQAIVEVQFGEFTNWVDKLKNAFTEYKNKPKSQNVWMVSDDSTLNGALGLMNCLKQEPGGDRFRCIFSATKLPRPIDFTVSPYKEILQKDLQMNVLRDHQWGTYRLLNLERDYDKTETTQAYIDVVKKGDFSSLKWFELMALGIKPDQANVTINFSGLDYKDFLLGSGSLGTDYIDRAIGTEFSGRRTDNGKRVMGIACSKAIATSIDINPQVLVEIPDNWSMEDGASTINALFLAWYSLVNRAQIEEGETILIHPATSANGLVAIQICQKMDCRILATATTDEKRQFLIDRYGIPEENIFNPNEANFVDEILTLTGANGVDVVFDSASGEKLSTSCPIVSNYGRYIEIDSPDSSPNAAAIRRNTQYFSISSLISEDSFEVIIPKLIKNFNAWFKEAKKYIKPVPRNVFRRGSIDQAINALNSKKTIGKVIVQIRDEEAQQVKIQAISKCWFDAKKSYILVGGLGGLGLEVAYWMVTRGAKKLVLVSRSGIKNDYQYVFVRRVANALKNKDDVQVKISTSDPSSMQGAEKLINESAELGPVGGIFHFATVLSDAFIEDQTAAAFKKVCAPKMDALGFLDTVTRKNCPRLDYFVAFSSQSSGRGFVGQNNYGYANSVMEHICEDRKRDGLPGQAIQYGPIGDVGLWAQNDHIDLTSIGMVIDTQRIPSCMEVLDRFLNLPHAIVSTIVRLEGAQQSSGAASAKNHIWQGIGIDMSSLPDNLTLGDVGMESILAVEMQQRIDREYSVNLSTDEIKQITVGQIKEYQTDNKATIKEKIAAFKQSLKK